MDASAMSAVRAVISALTVAALPLLTAALAASAGFQTATWPLPKKAHASPAGTSHPQAVGRIAFSSNKDGNHEIYAMNADGSGVVRLTFDSGEDYYPSWSPDGRRIAFASDRDGNGEIYAMNADGSGVARLTKNRASDWTPSWSPDGGRIAFVSHRAGNWEIYAMNVDGSGVARLTNNSANDIFPSWSPNGRRVAFMSDMDGNNEIHAMNANGSVAARLTNNPADDRAPSWSPDGRRIAFSSHRDGNSEIYAMNADGSDAANLTNNAANDWGASWSPDGRRIAFVSDRDGNDEIYTMNADGSGVARLANYFSDVRDLSWGHPTQAEKAALTATAIAAAEAAAAATAEARVAEARVAATAEAMVAEAQAAATAEAQAAATPIPTRVPCTPGKHCVSLHSDKTTVTIGEPIKLTLAAINLTSPVLTIHMVIEVPDGWSVRSTETTCTAALCNIIFKDLPTGINRGASIEIFPNETGEFVVHTHTTLTRDGEANGEEQEDIRVKVNPKPPTPTPAPTPPAPPTATPAPTPVATPAPKRGPPIRLPPTSATRSGGCAAPQGGAAADAGWLLAGLALPGLAFSGRLRKRAPLTHPNKPSTPAGSRPGRGHIARASEKSTRHRPLSRKPALGKRLGGSRAALAARFSLGFDLTRPRRR